MPETPMSRPTSRPLPRPLSRLSAIVQSVVRARHGLSLTRPWLPLTAGLLIVVVVGFLTGRTLDQSQTYDDEVRRSLVALSSVDAVLLAVLEMNNAQRGYILSGDEAFARRYRAEKISIENDLRKMAAILPASGASAETIGLFETALDRRLRSFRRIENEINRGNLTEAGVQSAEARMQTDNVRRTLAIIKTQIFNSLARQEKTSRKSRSQTKLLTNAGLLSASLLILISIILLVRRANELEGANAEILGMASGLEKRVAERTSELAEANEEVQRFAYIVSHDLRSPLVNVMGFTAELEDAQRTMADFVTASPQDGGPSLPDEVRTAVMQDMPEAITFIRAATNRMDRLIKAILQISREGRRTLAAEPIDLNVLLADLQNSLNGQLDAVGAEIAVGNLPQVSSDRLALEQVFGNLLDNAIKYLRPGVPGRITVEGETTSGKAVISIRDNGRGVAPRDQQRIFELFRRAGEQDQPGEGIGLAHVQALLRRLGGTIKLTSAPNEGSCFTVTLPLSMALVRR